MIQIPSTRERLSTLFYYLANCYDEKRFPFLGAVYQFILTEGRQVFSYYISISDGKADSKEEQHAVPSVTVYATVKNLFKVANGSLNSYLGLLTGKLRMKGSLVHLARMKKVFGKRFDRLDIPEIGREFEDFEIPAKRIWKKPDKVLVINGSPRGRGGFTYFYLQHFLKGIQKTGCKADVVNLCDDAIKIEPCRGCFTCEKFPYQCVIQDNGSDLLKQVENSYLTIYAFPIYTWSIPDKLHAFLNRHFVLVSPYFVRSGNLIRHSRMNKKERYSAVLIISGYPHKEQFDLVKKIFKFGYGFYVHIPLIAAIFRPAAEELFSNPSCQEPLEQVLRALGDAGHQLISEGKVARRTLLSVSKVYIPLSPWLRGLNMSRYVEQKKNIII